MMTTDSERRKVARRLREKKAECEERGYPWMCDDLILSLGYDHDYEAGDEVFDRLADLIEPSEPKVRCVAEVKVDGERLKKLAHDAVVELTGIDREALLAQVKELERCAWYFGLDFDADEPLRDRLKEASEDFAGCARRIREACGEVVA